MKQLLHQRVFLFVALASLLGLPAALHTSPLAPVQQARAAQATPTPSETFVIEAGDRTRVANPTGEQVLRLAGTILDPSPLDPAFARDVNSAFMTRQVFRGLTKFDENLEPVPELAQRIEISNDGLLYRFTLDDDARFADGREIIADDVVFSLKRALDPRTSDEVGLALAGPSYLNDIAGAPDFMRGESNELSGLRAIDSRTIEIELEEPKASFLMKLASAPGAVVDPNDVARGGEWWRDPNATGPFVVEEWLPDEQLTLAGNANYVGGKPALRQVTFRLGPSAANTFNLYQANEIDVSAVPVSAIDRVSDENSPLLSELEVAPMLSTWFIAFRDDVAPLDDPEIRRAIQLAYPRWKLADIKLNARMEVAHGVVPPGTLGRDWPASAPPEDLEAARQAIARSSYGSAENVPPIRIFGASPIGAETLRDVLAEDLGLRVEVLNVHWPQFNQGLAGREFPAYELTWVGDFPDPETFLWNLFGAGSPDNYSDYDNPEFNALLNKAAGTFDVDARAGLYAEAEEILLSENLVIPLTHDVRYTLIKPWVHGLVTTPLGMLYLEDAWLEQ